MVSAPGGTGADAAKAGPGVMRTRAGALVTRAGAAAVGAGGTFTAGSSADASAPTGSLTSSSWGPAPSDESAEVEGVAFNAKCAAATSAAATPTRRSGRPPPRFERRAVGRAGASSIGSRCGQGETGSGWTGSGWTGSGWGDGM